MKRLGEMTAKIGQATHQLWGDGCFYVGLDLPQFPGLIFKLFSYIIVCLETSKWLASRQDMGIRKKYSVKNHVTCLQQRKAE